MTRRVSVVILNFHGEKHLPGCLDSLHRQQFVDWDVVIIDNSHSDGLIERLSGAAPLRDWLQSERAKVVTNSRNIGFAAGANRGIAESKGEYILLLNQDVYLSESYLGELVVAMDTDEKTASATGKLLRMKVDGENEIIDSTGHLLFDDRVVINRGKDEPDSGQFDDAGEVFGVSAAAAMYRRKALEDVAFEGEIFDEAFFAYLEDVDMDFRLRRAGYISRYIPSAKAHHALAGSGGRKSFGIRFKAHANRYRIIWKHDSFTLMLKDYRAMLRQEFLEIFRTLFTSPLMFFARVLYHFELPRLLRQRRAIDRTSSRSFRDLYNEWVDRGRLKIG